MNLMSSSHVRCILSFFYYVTLTYGPAEHSRYLYQLQEPDTTTDESGGSDSWDSDESSASARVGWQRRAQSSSRTRAGGAPGKRRMSLLTGQYFDVPAHEHGYEHYECGAAPMKSVKRRFFASGAWDGGDFVDAELDARRGVLGGGGGRQPLGRTMERGGQYVDIFDEEDEEPMSVDS